MTTTLFIGKFCPFHEGHKLILDTLILLDKDDVTIAIKRKIGNRELKHFKKEIKEMYGHNIPVILLPNFDRIARGRTTGYKLQRILTPREMNVVSSTKIRREIIK